MKKRKKNLLKYLKIERGVGEDMEPINEKKLLRKLAFMLIPLIIVIIFANIINYIDFTTGNYKFSIFVFIILNLCYFHLCFITYMKIYNNNRNCEIFLNNEIYHNDINKKYFLKHRLPTLFIQTGFVVNFIFKIFIFSKSLNNPNGIIDYLLIKILLIFDIFLIISLFVLLFKQAKILFARLKENENKNLKGNDEI